MLEQVIDLRQRYGRVSYPALKHQFDVDDAFLADLTRVAGLIKPTALYTSGAIQRGRREHVRVVSPHFLNHLSSGITLVQGCREALPVQLHGTRESVQDILGGDAIFTLVGGGKIAGEAVHEHPFSHRLRQR